MRRRRVAQAVTLISSALFAVPAAAQPHPDTGEPLVRVSAHAENKSVAPGQTVWIGVRFRIEDGWHTYWPGQNDTGFGTVINPEGPPGVTFGPVRWPAPRRYESPGNILDHVYEDSVMALVPATLAKDAAVGQEVEIRFNLDWLVCKELCIPGEDTASIILPVTEEPGDADESVASEFTAARARMPYENGETERIVVVEWHGNDAVIRARGAHNITFYPDARSSRVADLLKSGTSESDALRLRVPGEQPKLSGYVEVTLRDQRSRIFRIESDPRNPT